LTVATKASAGREESRWKIMFVYKNSVTDQSRALYLVRKHLKLRTGILFDVIEIVFCVILNAEPNENTRARRQNTTENDRIIETVVDGPY
jgi:hypothetical protein